MKTEKYIEAQKDRYDREAAEHAEHYGDPYTQAYRDRFIRGPLFRFELKGLRVLDAMSASGVETGFLLSQGAEVIGLDISPNNAREYAKKWNLPCVIRSIHDTEFEDESFDAVYICGGLHHVLPVLEDTVREVFRILKSGGLFYFVEPNKDTWLNKLREIWYQKDERFADEEEAISYEKNLKKYLALGYKEEHVEYGGNIAYLVIGQSLALGMPLAFKKLIAQPLFILEHTLNLLPFSPKLFFSAAWRKQDI